MIRGLLVGAMLTACVGGADGGESITVYAAASLRDAFEEIAATYEEATGASIALSFEASSTLRTQIIEGAPADLFASADVASTQQVIDQGLADGPATVFAANGLTIVTPAAGDYGVESWQSLAGPAIRIIAAGEDVPITRYATELVDNLAALADAPAGFADAYRANIVSREDNVRAVLAKIELGEGDAAIVYETDAASSTAVRSVPVAEPANVLAEYAFVTLSDAGPGTDAFAAWLTGEEGARILEDFGFRVPPS